ncbi:MAG: FKBP-type peptidyl-prolyl cis-trans isomerase [Rikenellaceae bacterium]|nr:FKBP-type peptidyl-prolyl cis-trans isomerase [Rikenellaceae bacterium]
MNRFRLQILYIPLCALFLAGCGSKDDNTVADQRTAIENFLTNAYGEDGYDKIDRVYRVAIEREGNYNRSRRLEKGDIARFYFAGYEFTSRRIEPAFYSNVDWIIEELQDAGLDPIYWDQDIVEVRLGEGKVIKGIEKGLEGCREGDSVRVFLTTDLAFGSYYISDMDLYSAVEYVIWLEEVEKQ